MTVALYITISVLFATTALLIPVAIARHWRGIVEWFRYERDMAATRRAWRQRHAAARIEIRRGWK